MKQIELPKQFDEPIRADLIRRAVLAIQSGKRKPYGAYPRAGKDYSATLSKRRRRYRGCYGRGISRTPRKVLLRRGTQFYYVGAVAPNTVGGRRAHPPKAEKIWKERINKKERRKAIRSALAATLNLDLVKARGHRIEKLISVIDSKCENVKKTAELNNILILLGLEKELERVKKRKVRSGKGKMRGRKYKDKVGPLIVTSKRCDLSSSATNIKGVDICEVKKINAELLAPGANMGRLTIFTEEALKIMNENNLFLNKGIKK